MRASPLISVIIPMYNPGKYLHVCVDSLINQSYKNIEIILVNDGSTDRTDEVCLAYKLSFPKIKYYAIEHSGVSRARNIGLENAKGEWIAFIDADDWVSQDYLDNLFRTAYKQDIDIAINSFFIATKHGLVAPIENTTKRFIENKYLYLMDPKEGNGYLWGKLYSRDLFTDIYCDERFSFFEDMMDNFKLFSKAKRVCYAPYTAYYHRSYSGVTPHADAVNHLEATNVYCEIEECIPIAQSGAKRLAQTQAVHHYLSAVRQDFFSSFSNNKEDFKGITLSTKADIKTKILAYIRNLCPVVGDIYSEILSNSKSVIYNEYLRLFDDIKKGWKDIFIYGAGAVAKDLANCFNMYRIELKGFIISDGKTKDMDFMRYGNVFFLSEVHERSDKCVMIAVNIAQVEEIFKIINEAGFYKVIVL